MIFLWLIVMMVTCLSGSGGYSYLMEPMWWGGMVASKYLAFKICLFASFVVGWHTQIWWHTCSVFVTMFIWELCSKKWRVIMKASHQSINFDMDKLHLYCDPTQYKPNRCFCCLFILFPDQNVVFFLFVLFYSDFA